MLYVSSDDGLLCMHAHLLFTPATQHLPTVDISPCRLWTPSPDANFANDMRYLRGFSQLQDLIDQAIIKMHTNDTDLPLIETKQFPYPCYSYDQ